MTKLSTVPYAYEPGLIARLLGVALDRGHTLHVGVMGHNMRVLGELTLTQHAAYPCVALALVKTMH